MNVTPYRRVARATCTESADLALDRDKNFAELVDRLELPVILPIALVTQGIVITGFERPGPLSEYEVLIGLAIIIVFGVAAQVIANRLRLPGVLVLLVAGFIAGPATGILDPDELFGELLFPGVSLTVGLLLFDGGLNLRFREIKAYNSVIFRLVTVGVLITWAIGSVVVSLVTDLDTTTSMLAGAILIVSGPTVVIPILRRIMPDPPSGEILEWEGILIDPIGATIGVVMLGVVIGEKTAGAAATAIVRILASGVGVGIVLVVFATWFLARVNLPAVLRAPTALALAVAAFTVSNLLAPESGLFATTVFGLGLANQRRTPVDDIRTFEEGVGVLAIGSLFVVLGARMPLQAVIDNLVPGLIILAALVLIARPLAVLASVAGSSGITKSDTLFMMALAPRGIVAAASAAVFALELDDEGIVGGETLISLTFVVIIGAGVIYGLGAGPAGRYLGVVPKTPQTSKPPAEVNT